MSGIIQCSCLGSFGRFGNQLFQYSFVKAYAEKFNCELQIPGDWIGREIFEINDPPIIKTFPKIQLDIVPWGEVNIDLFGYFQFKEVFEILSLRKIRKWLKFKEKWIEMFSKERKFYIAAHLRRGDYVSKFNHIYVTIDESAYIRAIKKYGYDISDLIWVSEDRPTLYHKCKFNFLPDFFTLMNSDILFRSNSTFSVWASVLGNNITYSPVVDDKVGYHTNIDFVKGNHSKLVDDYKGASPHRPCEFRFQK